MVESRGSCEGVGGIWRDRRKQSGCLHSCMQSGSEVGSEVVSDEKLGLCA